MQRAFKVVAVMLALAASAGSALARPVVPAEKRFWDYSGSVPACNNPDVLSRIADRFNDAETEYWQSNLAIQGITDVQVTALRPWGLDHIPRNFCQGKAHISDNTVHEIYYSVAEDLGMIGMDEGVEFCVVGFDREFAYSPACKMAKP